VSSLFQRLLNLLLCLIFLYAAILLPIILIQGPASLATHMLTNPIHYIQYFIDLWLFFIQEAPSLTSEDFFTLKLLLGSALPLFCLFLLLRWTRHFNTNPKEKIHGSARWAERKDIDKMGL